MTARLASLSVDYLMDLDGYLVANGSPFALEDLPIARAAAFVWWYFVREAEQSDREKFRARLWIPPQNDPTPIPAKSPWSAESETKAFASLKAATSRPSQTTVDPSSTIRVGAPDRRTS